MNKEHKYEVIVPMTVTYTLYRKFLVDNPEELLNYEMAEWPEIEANSDFGGQGIMTKIQAFHILDAKITEL